MFTVAKLFTPLFQGPRANAPVAASVDAASGPAEHGDEAEDDRPGACGWYDSSHDLSHGLTVREDVSAAELPLANWLELHLGSWRAVPQPA